MPVEQGGKAVQLIQEHARLAALQDCIGPIGHGVEQAVHFLMVAFQQIKGAFQPGIKGDQLREIMAVFDVVVTVQFVQQRPAVM